ncbi:MAG: ABC transporter ATP-binding protein [Candidatus Altimarinota bacterium]
MITLKHIAKTYISRGEKVELFQDLSWEIQKGSWVALMGASGAGKSTLLSLIAGIQSPDAGEIYLSDTNITDFTRDAMTEYRGKHIAFIFQAFELIPNLTVSENIDLVLDISKAERRYESEVILEKVGLKGKGNRYPNELSGGEQQRVAIARAFVSKVPFLFADEPTGNLDEKNAEKIMSLIRDLHEETKNTIIMITHDPGVASHADAIFRLSGGTLMKDK